MLSKIEFTLDIKDLKGLNYSLSSKFHGVIMEHLEPEVADYLHISDLMPYSQNIEILEDKLIWRVFGINSFAYENIILNLAKKESFYIKALDTEIKCFDKRIESISDEKLFSDCFSNNSSRDIILEFKTTTAFKSNGKYLNFPDLRFILQSIMRKHDKFMSQEIYDIEAMDYFISNTSMISFNIRSSKFKVEKVYIPGFIGYIKYRIEGPQQIVNLANYMFRFAEYSGIGIKTSLGMGRIKIGGEDATEKI